MRFIIPVTAGSAVDITARTIADHLTQQLGQPFIVENRTGAGGTVGMGYVAKSSEPDGYTVLVHSAAFVIQPSTFPNLGFDGGKDFAGVTLLANVPLVMIASPEKYKTLRELVDAAKAKPGSVNYATVGYGAAAHLTAERLRLAAGFQAQQILFCGAPEAMTEVLAQRVDFFFAPTARRHPAGARGENRSTRSVELEARAVPARCADHDRGRLSKLRLQFLGRHVGAGENTARHRRQALSGSEKGDGAAKRSGQARGARQRASAGHATAEFDKLFHDEIALNAELVKDGGHRRIVVSTFIPGSSEARAGIHTSQAPDPARFARAPE